MDRFYDFFLSLGPEGQFGIFMVSICTVYTALWLTSCLFDWLFRKPEKPEEQEESPLCWNIVVTDMNRDYRRVVVLPVGTPLTTLHSVFGAAILEGPFFDLDEAIARKDELKKRL